MASSTATTPRVSYIIAELEDADSVFAPIKTASRVKYTCFDISRHYIVFGTTAGGIVILQHDNLSYLKTLSAKEGPVCQAALAPDENIVGFATCRGVAVVMEHNAERGAAQPQRLQLSYEHKGSLVTCMQWNVSSSKLFIGDDKGKVSVISVSTSRTRNIFQVPTTTLMKLDSRVVQLDFAQDHLLVSTLTRCYLCDTNKEQFLTIGKKLRDGEYGACFYPGLRSVDPCTVFCSRPGSRMWEVDIKGNVCCTHQFKTALAVKPERLYTFRSEVNMEDTGDECKPITTNFQKLLLIWPSTEDSPFIFTWSSQGAFVFDLKRAEVVLWSDDIKGIKDVKCQRGDIYIYFIDGKFAKYTLMTVEQGVCRLYQQGFAIHGAQLLLLKKASLCSSRLNIHIPASFMIDMLQKASEMGKSYLFSGLTSVLNSLGLSPDKLSQSSRSSSAMSEPVRLNSGIYIVNKLMRDADDDAPSSVCLSRWRSASPVFRHSSRSPHSSPSRCSDKTTYSPKSQRSTRFGDSSTKKRASSLIRTPDSTDSGTSGRVSEMSDETQSSPSGKDIHNKENWQSWAQMQNSHNANERKLSLDANINGENSIISYKSSSLKSADIKSGSLVDRKSSVPEALPPSVNGDEFNNNESNVSTPSISLNLHDLSKHANSGEKRVSFKSRVSSSSDESWISPKVSANAVNGIDHNDSVFSPQYECPESLYDEYRYAGMALYGSMMMMPNLDMSILFGTEADFQNIKESLSNKLTSGKNLIMKNLRGLEQRIMQEAKPELLDVKLKHSDNNQPTSPVSYSETERSSEFHSTDRQFWSFLPPIDINELVEVTRSTWSSARELTILSDKKTISNLLENWVNLLHTAQVTAIQYIINSLQNYHNPSSHSYKDDDTLRSTCSQITSQESSPSENCEISDRLEQEDPSVSESRSYEDDKHLESTHSFNVEISDSSTLRTESVLGKLVNLEEFVFVYDPFRLNSEDHSIMCELVVMCFQLKIWGKIEKVMDMRSSILKYKEKSDEFQKKESDSLFCTNDLPNSLKPPPTIKQSESANSFLKPDLNCIGNLSVQKKTLFAQHSDSGISSVAQNGDATSNGESSSSHVSLYSSKFDDIKSAAFIQNYFHFFDVQRLRELLNLLNQPCIKTWSVMLLGVSLLSGSDEFTRKLASDQLETAASCLERNYVGPILISHLLKIFKVNSERAIDLCLQRSYHITPLDVLYLSKSSDSHPKPFLEYITRVVDCLPEIQRPKVLDKLLHHNEVRLEWIHGILQTDEELQEKLKCSCGWPRPGSHLHPWRHSQLLLHLLSTTYDMDNNLLDLCFSAGFWPGYLMLVKKLQLNSVHRKLVISLCDINLLSASNPLGYLPSNLEEWREFFSLFAQSSATKGFVVCSTCNKKHNASTDFPQCSSDSSQWSSSLQWETIARVALSHLDSIKVIELLQELDIPNGAFTSAFYKALVMTFLMDKQQSALMHRTLTTVGSYLWSRKLQTMPPEARLVLQKEKEKPNQVTKSDDKDSVKPGCIYVEEPENHWGVKTSLNSVCKICKLPLTSHLSPSVGGVTVYRCAFGIVKMKATLESLRLLKKGDSKLSYEQKFQPEFLMEAKKGATDSLNSASTSSHAADFESICHSYHTVCSNEGFCIVCLSSNIDDG